MFGEIIATLATVDNFLLLNLGMAIGIIFGALPGLTAVIGISLLLPVTYSLNIHSSLILLISVYCGAIYGGSITAILIDTPGAPAAACTGLDGHPLMRQGKAGLALDIALRGSVFGGLLSTVVLMLCGPLLARYALRFGAAEMFGLGLIGLTIIPSVVGNSPPKGFLAATLGLLVTIIGVDSFSGMTRMTFGISRLNAGFNLAPTMIGLFAFSQVIKKVYEANKPDAKPEKFNIQTFPWKEFFKHKWCALRSMLIGTLIGAIPGTGSALAAFVSYNAAKRASKHPERFGTGEVEGIIASETANNAVTGAAFIPLLSLGIPGDTATAVLMGAMVIAGVAPGPTFYSKNPELGYFIMVVLVLANIFMFLQGSLLIKLFAKVAEIPSTLLYPIIAIFCIMGAYASSNSMFDVWLMIVFGMIGFFIFDRFNIPKAPFIIARILGGMTEVNLRRALQVSRDGAKIFFTKPISLICILICVFMIFYPYLKPFIAKRREKYKSKKSESA